MDGSSRVMRIRVSKRDKVTSNYLCGQLGIFKLILDDRNDRDK